MLRTCWILALLLILGLPGQPRAANAQASSSAEPSADTSAGSFTGDFRVGYRLVDSGGSFTKFREDLNLEDGPRLFSLSFDFEAPEALRGVDRVQLDVSNFGGDPFESWHLAVRKYGLYDLRYQRTVAEYFYADTILPVPLSNPRLSNAGDFHTFDFERVRDTASLGLQLSRRLKLDVGFERFTKRGESTTTLDIQRDEFELDRPIEESYDEMSLALEIGWDKATLIVEERFRSFDNAVELFLPGLSLGENPEDATVLDFFFLDQPYELTSQQHTVRLNARPNQRLLIRAAAMLQRLDLDAEAAERSQGVDFAGRPFTTDVVGEGDIERNSNLLDLDVSFLINPRLVLVGGVRRHQSDQEGVFAFDSEGGRSSWDIETLSGELGLEAHLSPQLTVGGGVRLENREVEHASASGGAAAVLGEPEREETEHTGFFANLAWRPSKAFRLDLEAEDSSYDDPFTLSSPTDRQRYRARGRYTWASGPYLQATYVAYRFENANSQWRSDRDQLEARAGWRRAAFDGSLGYSRIEADREIDQLVTTNPGFGGGVTFLFPIFYTSEADFLDARLRWRATDAWSLGGSARLYENDGTFATTRSDLYGFVEVLLPQGYQIRLGYRMVDYEESLATGSFDDYDARITELSIGYRW